MSVPAKEPVTEAVPPLLGNTKPTSLVLLVSILWPEKVTTLLAIELGVHRAVQLGDPDAASDVARTAQALDGSETVSVEVPPVTLETSDALVVQVDAAIAIVTVSGLVPPFCRGGSKVTVPVPEQVTDPVATVGVIVDELVGVELLAGVELLGLLGLEVEPLGLEAHAAGPSDSVTPTRRSLGSRRILPRATTDTAPALG